MKSSTSEPAREFFLKANHMLWAAIKITSQRSKESTALILRQIDLRETISWIESRSKAFIPPLLKEALCIDTAEGPRMAAKDLLMQFDALLDKCQDAKITFQITE